jgi:hypothetical protein
MPEDQTLIGNINTIFTQISEFYYMKNIFLICKIYRKGRLVFDEKSITSTISTIKKDKDQKDFKRCFGICVYNISPSVIEFLGNENSMETPIIKIYTPINEKDFSEIHKSK